MKYFFLLILSYQSYALSIDISGIFINIPEPQGFQEVSEILPQVKSFAETMTPKQHKLLMIFIDSQDIENISLGLNRYILLQTPAQNIKITPQDFKEAIGFIKQENTLTEQEKEQISQLIKQDLYQKFNTITALKIGQKTPLGVFLEQEKVIAVASIESGEINNQVYFMVSSTITMLIKEQILFAYVFAKYQNEKDIAWVQAMSKQWVDRILMENKVPEEELQLNYHKAIISITIIVILFAFIIYLYKRFV